MWIQNLCVGGNSIYISELATVEVVHAIRKRAASTIERSHGRTRQHLLADRDQLIDVFRQHCDPLNGDYAICVLVPDTYSRAAQLVRDSGIRSLDALQLASALIVRDQVIGSGTGVPAPVFLTADKRFLPHVRKQYPLVDDPENHSAPGEQLQGYHDWRDWLERATYRLYHFTRRLNRG
jgi:predicted nucleic acid-binding protein